MPIIKPIVPLNKAQRQRAEENGGLAGTMVKRFLNRHPYLVQYRDDLLSDAQLALCRAAGKWGKKRLSKKTGKPVLFSSYACVAISHALATWMREYYSGRDYQYEMTDNDGDEDPVEPIAPENRDLEISQALEVVTKFLTHPQVPPRQREAVMLCYFKGYTYREVGRHFGVSKQMGAQLIWSGLRRMKQIARRWGCQP